MARQSIIACLTGFALATQSAMQQKRDQFMGRFHQFQAETELLKNGTAGLQQQLLEVADSLQCCNIIEETAKLSNVLHFWLPSRYSTEIDKVHRWTSGGHVALHFLSLAALFTVSFKLSAEVHTSPPW